MDSKTILSMLGSYWKWFKHAYETEKGDSDDLYWHNLISGDSGTDKLIEQYKNNKIAQYCISEMCDIKDLGIQKPDLRVYYNVFADCSKIVKASVNDEATGDMTKKELFAKYNGMTFAARMFDLCSELVLGAKDGNKENVS